jgi:hypothetical protein
VENLNRKQISFIELNLHNNTLMGFVGPKRTITLMEAKGHSKNRPAQGPKLTTIKLYIMHVTLTGNQ